MQNAKDSFYIALRDRLALLNPSRTINVRGVQRPALLVEEAEAPAGELINDAFVVRWTGSSAIEDMPCTLVSILCEVHYATSGSGGNSGLDRGRLMKTMDRELISVLQPMCTPKMRYTSTPAMMLQTNVFWTEPVLGILETIGNQLLRVAKVTVFAFEEPGES